MRRSNKQRSHSSSNNAAINQSHLVFLNNGRQPSQGNADSKDPAMQMMVTNGAKGFNQLSQHGRNNRIGDTTGSRKQEEFTRDQKLQQAENAIQDQYAQAIQQNEGFNMTSSFRNGKHNHSMSNPQAPAPTHHYEKMRNSYQSPSNKYVTTDMKAANF